MQPLFNLYGNTEEEVVSTQTQITDEDIKKAKIAAQKTLLDSIESHEILGPRDEPDGDLLLHCNDVVAKLLHAFETQDDRDSQKVLNVINGKPFPLKAKALHKLITDRNSAMINIVQELQYEPNAALNCIAVAYHFEPTPEDLGNTDNSVDPLDNANQPFYKKHPFLTAVAAIAIIHSLVKK